MGRMTTVEASTWDAVAEALSELKELESEMRAWADSLKYTNLVFSQTYAQIEKAADALPSFGKKIEIPNTLEDDHVRYQIYVSPRSRRERRDNTVAALLAVSNFIGIQQDLDIAKFRRELLDLIEHVSAIEFPGMR